MEFTQPDFQMLANLQKNCYQFSAAKTYQQMRAMTQELTDSDGKLRSFRDFKEAVSKISNDFNKTWLKTEYDLAIAGGQAASKWVDAQKNSEALPYMEFDAVMDMRTTSTCARLNGTILPIGHPFWNAYYPPNHFNCRSTVRMRTADAIPTEEDKIPGIEIPKMFRTNLAKEGLVFPAESPYYKDLPENVNGKNKVTNPYNFTHYKPILIKNYENGGTLSIHPLVDNKSSDFKDVLQSGQYFAEQGKKVMLLPKTPTYKCQLHQHLYADLKDTIYKQKNPDLLIDGLFYEFEGYEKKKNALKNMLTHGVKQSSRLIIKDEVSSTHYIHHRIKGRVLNEGQKIDEVWILKKDGNLEQVYP